MSMPLPLSIVIPSYHREVVLVETTEALLALDPPAAEILLLTKRKPMKGKPVEVCTNWPTPAAFVGCDCRCHPSHTP